jgi:hypothetical protein
MERVEKSLFALSVLSLVLLLLSLVLSATLNNSMISVIILFFMALLIVFGLTYFFVHILIKIGLLDSDLDGIIRDSDWYPSLSRLQFILWTFLIGFVYVWFLLLNVWLAHCGDIDFKKLEWETILGLPDNLLLLMGITSLTTVASKGLSSFKYSTRQKPSKLPPLGTMLLENQIPSVGRYQMFLWTCIGTLTYFVLVVTAVSRFHASCGNIIEIPDCPQVLLGLMGISQGAYLGGKSISKSSGITAIIPAPGIMDRSITIFGPNFGPNKGVVLFNETEVKPSEWTNGMIKIDRLPQIELDSNDNICNVRVVNGSEITPPYEYEISPLKNLVPLQKILSTDTIE